MLFIHALYLRTCTRFRFQHFNAQWLIRSRRVSPTLHLLKRPNRGVAVLSYSRILFFLSKLYYQINLGYVNRSSVKIGNISSSFCFCACIDLHMLYFISKRGFTYFGFFSVSQCVANCFYFTMPLPYTKEISQYTYNQ